MLTLFTIPKPFQGHSRIIQRNAIRSWLQIRPECEVILFGDDDGVSETAGEFGIKHIPAVDKNEFGTPLLSSVFSAAQKEASYDRLMYINADIITMPDLVSSIMCVEKEEYLICGRRWDLDINEEMRYEGINWVSDLKDRISTHGTLHGYSGIDYFVFPRHMIHMPAFAVGRPGWDNWLIYHARSHDIPVIDATDAITIIHQNHNYSHSKFGEKQRVGGPELEKNIRLAGGFTSFLTLRDADWVLNERGLTRPGLLPRFYSMLSVWYPWRLVLSVKRKIQESIVSL